MLCLSKKIFQKNFPVVVNPHATAAQIGNIINRKPTTDTVTRVKVVAMITKLSTVFKEVDRTVCFFLCFSLRILTFVHLIISLRLLTEL